VFLVLTIISGTSSLFSVELIQYIKPLFSKAAHNILAITCYTTGMVAIINAYITKSWLVKNDPGEERIVMICCLCIVLALTLIGPAKTAVYHIKGLTAIFAANSDASERRPLIRK
jgi:glycopeptide antibiotics resistance protein